LIVIIAGIANVKASKLRLATVKSANITIVAVDTHVSTIREVTTTTASRAIADDANAEVHRAKVVVVAINGVMNAASVGVTKVPAAILVVVAERSALREIGTAGQRMASVGCAGIVVVTVSAQVLAARKSRAAVNGTEIVVIAADISVDTASDNIAGVDRASIRIIAVYRSVLAPSGV
jgi:hypothetical protein